MAKNLSVLIKSVWNRFGWWFDWLVKPIELNQTLEYDSSVTQMNPIADRQKTEQLHYL